MVVGNILYEKSVSETVELTYNVTSIVEKRRYGRSDDVAEPKARKRLGFCRDRRKSVVIGELSL